MRLYRCFIIQGNGDFTHLKTTIDVRFNKLEKTVEKIHNDFKSKMLDTPEHVVEVEHPRSPTFYDPCMDLQRNEHAQNDNDPDKSLSLDFQGDTKIPQQQWNDVKNILIIDHFWNSFCKRPIY